MTIGATGETSDASVIDDVAIEVNDVVVKSINEPRTTWNGNPARKISSNNSYVILSPPLFSWLIFRF